VKLRLPWFGFPLAVGLSCVAATAVFAAQAIPLWPAKIDTIRVRASRPFPEERVGAVRGFVQVVPLGASAPASADLGDLLQRAAGVRIRRLGGLGAMSLASVRGSSPSQVAVAIDDIPISTASDALANLSLLPVRLFDSVEIARGPGDGDAAGTIRLKTPERMEAPLRLRFGGGSFGTASLSGTGGVRRGPVSLFAAGGRLSSRGDYPYLDRGGTPYASRDDRIVRRRNNEFRQDDALVRAGYALARNVKVDYTGHGLWKDGGIPGTENLQTRRVHDRFVRVLHGLGIDASDSDGREARVAAHVQQDRDRYRNPDGEVGLGRADRRSTLTARGASAVLAAPIPFPWIRGSARITGSLQDERWRTEDLLYGVREPTRDRVTRAAGVEVLLKLGLHTEISAKERLLRAGRIEGSAPRIGASCDLGHGLGARASWGRFQRLPSFQEMYGQGGIQEGNGTLVPEHGDTWDAGATIVREGARARLYAELVHFETRTRDAIVWIQNSQWTSRPENLERTGVRGIEALARAAVRPSDRLPAFEWNATTTIQDARDDGPSAIYHGKRLPYLSARQASLETRVDGRRFALVHSIDLESSLYRDRYNSLEKRRAGRALQDLETTWRASPGRLDATLAIRNLTNGRAQDVDGFPLPGRSVFVQLTWTIR